MVLQEGKPFSFLHVEDFLRKLIDRESHLLILGIRVVVVCLEVVDFLMCDDFPHELHRRIVFPAVFSFLCRDGDSLELTRLLDELDFEVGGFSRYEVDGLLDISHR